MPTTRNSDDNETEPQLSSKLRKQLRDASWQANDSETLPTLSPEMREQLRAAAIETVKVDSQDFESEARITAGNALLKNHTTVVFALIDSEVLLPIHVKERVVIGRLDMESDEKVDVDLTPYGGRERGVSRRHAILYRTDYTVSLVDLKSSNGTYLNGVKLVPHQPRLLREGDEVRMADMRFHVYFDD